MARDNSGSPQLRYVESRRLRGALHDPLDVWSAEGRRIGSFEGVVVDFEERRARYLVVDRGRLVPNRCLIPLPAQLDFVHQALRVDAENVSPDEWPRFDARTFPPFRVDEDVTAGLAHAS